MVDKLHFIQLAFSMILMVSALCLFAYDGSVYPWIGVVIGLVGGLVCWIIRLVDTIRHRNR